MGMLLWSLDEQLWTGFESSTRTHMVLVGAGVVKLEKTEMGPWLPPIEVQRTSDIAFRLKMMVSVVFDQPNGGAEDVRFEKDLHKLAELLELHESFYVASARGRSLLSTQDGVFRWRPDQKDKLEQLRQLLHPKHFGAVQNDVDTARVTQVVFYANTVRTKESTLEGRLLWRVTHLFPVLAFCEIMVACEGDLGAAVAGKSALELVAHFVSGGMKKEFDPFSDATDCKYTELTTSIGRGDLYKKLCAVVHLDEESDVETVKELCKEVLDAVVLCKEFRQPVEVKPDEEIRVLPFVNDADLDPPFKETGKWCVVRWRDYFDDWLWSGSVKNVKSTMSWTGMSSARLTQLGFDKVWAYDSPATVTVEELLKALAEKLEQPELDGEKKNLYRAIDSLIRATCIACNLSNRLAIGAIVRELHLTIEKLIKLENPKKEEENNLDILEQDLSDELNEFRQTVHEALSSFTHPGWLIRTELLQVKKLQGDWHALVCTGNLPPPFIGRTERKGVDGERTEVTEIPLSNRSDTHWRMLIAEYPPVLRKLMQPDDERGEQGFAFAVPFEAFELCRRALEKLL
jgi:hypothetical protein